MKKTLSLLLSLFLALSVCTHVSAEQTVKSNILDLTGTSLYENTSSLCWIDNDLYILGAQAIYHWAEGMETPEVFCDLSDSSEYQYVEQSPEGEEGVQAWSKAIRFLFTNDNVLYGLHPYSGQIFEITQETMQPVVQLPDTILKAQVDDVVFFREIKGVVCKEGKIYLLMGTDSYEDYEKTELFSFSLADQSLTTCSSSNVQGLAAGAEGKLVFFIQGEESAIWQYDIASDALDAQLAVLQPEDSPSGLAWYAGKDTLAY